MAEGLSGLGSGWVTSEDPTWACEKRLTHDGCDFVVKLSHPHKGTPYRNWSLATDDGVILSVAAFSSADFVHARIKAETNCILLMRAYVAGVNRERNRRPKGPPWGEWSATMFLTEEGEEWVKDLLERIDNNKGDMQA